MSNITAEDLIFYNEGDKVYSGGFNINSILLKKGLSPLFTLNSDKTLQNGGGNNVSDLFKELVIPSGLLYLPNKMFGGANYENENDNYNTDEDEETDFISEDIHDKLLSLVSVGKNNNSKKTRRFKATKSKKSISKKHIK
jgi:hypothetical protein